jgi:phosphate transport system permease protein
MSTAAPSDRERASEAPPAAPPRQRVLSTLIQDKIYYSLLFIASLSILILVAAIAMELTLASRQSLHQFGLRFFAHTVWDPVHAQFGGLGFVLGTLYTSFWALLVAVPIGLGAAIFLAEVAPNWVRTPVSFLIELLAAIPSVVYGLWGVFVLSPWLLQHVETPISERPWLTRFPLFNAPPNGNDILAASLILAIMVLPFITAVSRDVLRAIPGTVREGSLALGATRWETIQGVVLPYARAGIIGAVILGLGRALGETMAVTMVIGNELGFHTSLFSSGYTMASIIANEFNEASFPLYRSALIEIGLTLFIVTMIVNGCARILIYYTAKSLHGGGRRA